MKKIFNGLNKRKYLVLLVIFIAIFFRFWRLNQVPPGLYPDVAVNGTDAIAANENLDYKIFYPNNNGREGLFINLIALSFKVFGTGICQLRLAGAIIGILTVYGIYLLTKELIGEKEALLASLFTASSFWAVNFSRIGFRAIMVPFILVFAFYFLLRKFDKDNKSIWDFIISGTIFGLGFYTYISFKIAPLILIVAFLYMLFKNTKSIKKYWKQLVLFIVSICVVSLPILLFQLTASEAAVRTGQISIFNPEVNKGDLIGTLAKTTLKSLGMFNFYGDPNWRHNLPYVPALNFFVGIFFIVGLIILTKKMFNKKEEYKNRFSGFFMISWLIIMLAPAVLTEEGMPHSLRAIGSMVPAYIIAGYGAIYVYKIFYNKKGDIVKKFALAVISVILIFDFTSYFVIWPALPQVIDQFTTRYVEIGEFLNNMPDNYNKYVVINQPGVKVNNFPVQAQTIQFVTYNKAKVIFLNEEDINNIKIEKKSIITDLKNDKQVEKLLKLNNTVSKVNPKEVITSYESTNFTSYFVE